MNEILVFINKNHCNYLFAYGIVLHTMITKKTD